MADKIVKGIMTVDGIAAVDYESLANLPTIDAMPTVDSRNAVQSGGVYTALEGKLDSQDGKAADSILFGGQAPEYYATAEKVQDLEEALGINAEGDSAVSTTIKGIEEDIQNLLDTKLDKTAQAVDSAKLGGQDPSYYATTTACTTAQQTADDAIDMGISIYTHEKNGTVHNLIGPANSSTLTGRNIKFASRAEWEPGDTLTINGEECVCYDILKTPIEDTVIFANDVAVTATLSWLTVSKKWACFFKTGGAGIPSGTTSPADNVRIWQRCAGLQTSYSTISELLNDTAALKTIMNDNNAIEYLINSIELQEEVFASEAALVALDASMPIITPSATQANTMPYGTITRSETGRTGSDFKNGTCYGFNYTFTGNNSSASAHGGYAGAWIQYNFDGDRPIWLYKSQIRPTYVYQGVVMRVQGVLPDGTLVQLADDLSVAALADGSTATPTEIVHRPNTYKCVAVRFYVVSGTTDNSAIYFNGGKVWGK